MWVCQSCFAEGLSGEECPFCGALKGGDVDASEEGSAQPELLLEEMRFSAPSDATKLFPGMLLGGQYTVQLPLGERDGWTLYQVVDQLSAKIWLLKTGDWRPEVDEIIESNHIGLIASKLLRRDPAQVLLPPRPMIVVPNWSETALERRLSISIELLEIIEAAHRIGRASFQIVPTQSWAEKVEVYLDDSRSVFSKEAAQLDLRSIVLFVVEMICEKDTEQLPQDLSPMEPRIALWLRKMWHGLIKSPQAAIKEFRQRRTSGVLSYAPHIEARLSVLSDEAFICSGILAERGGLLLLQRGAVRAGFGLRKGRIVLSSSPMWVQEAGLRPPKPNRFSSILHSGMVSLDKQSVAGISEFGEDTDLSVYELTELVQLALWFEQKEAVSVFIRKALSSCRTSGDWLDVAEMFSTTLQDSGAADEALSLAQSKAVHLTDVLSVAAWMRWRRDDVGGARKLLRVARKELNQAKHWLQWAEAELALFDVTPQKSLSKARILSQKESFKESAQLLGAGYEHLGPQSEWDIWGRDLLERAKTGEEHRLLADTFRQTNQPDLYRLLEQRLLKVWLNVEDEAKSFGIETKEYSWLDIEQVQRQINTQRERQELAQQLQKKASMMGGELLIKTPLSLRDLQELNMQMHQIEADAALVSYTFKEHSSEGQNSEGQNIEIEPKTSIDDVQYNTVSEEQNQMAEEAHQINEHSSEEPFKEEQITEELIEQRQEYEEDLSQDYEVELSKQEEAEVEDSEEERASKVLSEPLEPTEISEDSEESPVDLLEEGDQQSKVREDRDLIDGETKSGLFWLWAAGVLFIVLCGWFLL